MSLHGIGRNSCAVSELTLRGVAIITCSYKRPSCRFSTGRMATSQFAVWGAAFSLFLVLQTYSAQQGYVFYDMHVLAMELIYCFVLDMQCVLSTSQSLAVLRK